MCYTLTQISSNVLFSFGYSNTAYMPNTLSLTNLGDNYTVGPFWGDSDLQDDSVKGSVLYQSFTAGATQLGTVNSFIRAELKNSFSGNWLLVAKWNRVPRFSESNSIVSDLRCLIYSQTHNYWCMLLCEANNCVHTIAE